MSSDLLPNLYRSLTAFWNLPHNVHHFKMCIYHLLCRHINKIVHFKYLVIVNNLIYAFHPEASKHLARRKILLFSCQCFWKLKYREIQRLVKGVRQRWMKGHLVLSNSGSVSGSLCWTLVHTMVHSSLCPPHTLYGVGQNSPCKIIVPGLCILERLKPLRFA